jgi:hypothetical protein
MWGMWRVAEGPKVMGGLFPGVRVNGVGEFAHLGEGTFFYTAKGQRNGVSGAVYEVEYYLIQFDAWPEAFTALELGDFTLIFREAP